MTSDTKAAYADCDDLERARTFYRDQVLLWQNRYSVVSGIEHEQQFVEMVAAVLAAVRAETIERLREPSKLDLESFGRSYCYVTGQNPDLQILVPIHQLIGGSINAGRSPFAWERCLPTVRTVLQAVAHALSPQPKPRRHKHGKDGVTR